MRGIYVVAAVAAVLAFTAVPAAAADPPAGAIGNVEFVKNLPGMKWATAINFIQYDHSRGVDILKVGESGKTLAAPQFSARHKRLVAKASRGLRADPVLGWMCPLPRR